MPAPLFSTLMEPLACRVEAVVSQVGACEYIHVGCDHRTSCGRRALPAAIELQHHMRLARQQPRADAFGTAAARSVQQAGRSSAPLSAAAPTGSMSTRSESMEESRLRPGRQASTQVGATSD